MEKELVVFDEHGAHYNCELPTHHTRFEWSSHFSDDVSAAVCADLWDKAWGHVSETVLKRDTRLT